jgi:hypothetical protein
MPDTIKTYVSDGTQTIYTFEFEYLSKAFVTVLVEGIPVGFALTDTYQITLDAPAAQGDVIIIKRETDPDRLVQFVDGSILLANDLNVSAMQAIHIAAEALDAAGASLILDETGAYSASFRRIADVGDPIQGRDAVNKQWVENDVQSSVVQARSARDAAQAAQGSAETAEAGAVVAASDSQFYRDQSLAAQVQSASYRDLAQGYQDAAANHSVAAAGYKDEAQTARDVSLVYRNTAQDHKDAAAASAAAAATFDPASFASLAGGAVFTGPVTLGDNNNTLGNSVASDITFSATGAASYINLKRSDIASTPLIFRDAGNTQIASVGAAGTGMASGHTIATREKGDARWVRSSGGDLTGGFAASYHDFGNVSSGIVSLDYMAGNYGSVVNSGAFTLSMPSLSEGVSFVLRIYNDTGAGAVTFNNFTRVTGDALTTTATDEFLIYITNLSFTRHAHVVALQ